MYKWDHPKLAVFTDLLAVFIPSHMKLKSYFFNVLVKWVTYDNEPIF